MNFKELFKPNWKISIFIILVPYILMVWEFPFHIYFGKTMVPEEYGKLTSSTIWLSITTLIASIAPAVTIVSGMLLGRGKAFSLYLISYLPILFLSIILVVYFLLNPLFFLTPNYPQKYIETISTNQVYNLFFTITNFVVTPLLYIWLTTELLKRRIGLFISILLPVILQNIVTYIMTFELNFYLIEGIIFAFLWSLIIRRGFMKILKK